QFIGVESMRRLTELKHHEIRDVDDVVDRANADALNFRAQPLRAGTHLHVVDLTQRKNWTFSRRRNSHARFLNLDLWLGRRCLELLSAQRCNFTGQTEMAQQIAAVWRDLDVQNRIRWEKIRDGRANFCIGRQYQQPGRIFAETELDRAAKHSFRLDAAQFTFSDLRAVRQLRAWKRERNFVADFIIRRAAHD